MEGFPYEASVNLEIYSFLKCQLFLCTTRNTAPTSGLAWKLTCFQKVNIVGGKREKCDVPCEISVQIKRTLRALQQLKCDIKGFLFAGIRSG